MIMEMEFTKLKEHDNLTKSLISLNLLTFLHGPFKKCQVTSVSYAFGHSLYTYVTSSSYRTVLDPTLN